MSQAFYRFKRTEIESMSMLKGTASWYDICDEEGNLLFACHVTGSCVSGVTTFHASQEDERVLFRMEPKRKFLNLTWFVNEGEQGPRVATIELFKTRGFKVRGPHGHEVFRAVDPQGAFDKLMQDVLEGACSKYALVADEHVIGTFDTRERPPGDEPKRKGLLGLLIKGLDKVLARDWCVELEDEGKVIDDHRPLLGGLMLLLEQTIPNDQAH